LPARAKGVRMDYELCGKMASNNHIILKFGEYRKCCELRA